MLKFSITLMAGFGVQGVCTVLVKCWSFPALGCHQKWNSHGTDACLNSNKFAFILFPTSVFVGHWMSVRAGMEVLEFLCGLWVSDSLAVALLLLAAVVWRQQHSAVSLKMAFSFLVGSWWVLIGIVLSLTTACVSSGIKTLLVLGYQSCSGAVSQGHHWFLVCSFFWVQSGPSAADPASFLGKKHHFMSLQCWKLAAAHTHQAFSPVLSEFGGKGGVILILFSTCMCKVLF